MGSEIIVKRLYDYEIVLGTMDSLWESISEDGVDKYAPDLLSDIWLGLFIEDKYLGMYCFKSLTSIMYEGHVFMLKDKRQYSVDGAYAVMEWLKYNTEFNKIVVNVAECFPNVIEFVKKIGMKEEGYSSECFFRDEICGIYRYGITRGQMR